MLGLDRDTGDSGMFSDLHLKDFVEMQGKQADVEYDLEGYASLSLLVVDLAVGPRHFDRNHPADKGTK